MDFTRLGAALAMAHERDLHGLDRAKAGQSDERRRPGLFPSTDTTKL